MCKDENLFYRKGSHLLSLVEKKTIMKKNVAVVAAFFFWGGIISCGSESNKTADQSPEGSLPLEYRLIGSSSAIETSEDGIKGRGSLVFYRPLPLIQSNQHFIVRFRIEEGGFVDIRTFAQKDLKGGISLKIERMSGNNQKTTLSAEHKGISDDVSKEFAKGLDGKLDGISTIRIDMHNKEVGGHMLVWIADSSESLDSSTRVFNDLVGANGVGTFWGLVVKGAEIIHVEVREAEEKH